jgi:hypothetical protein
MESLTMPVNPNPLDDVFRVLSGTRKPKFLFEPELRLFQFRIWLLSDDDDDRSLKDAAALFASIMLRRRIRLDRKRSSEATPSELIDGVFERKAYRDLYDEAFPYPRTPYTLSLNLSLPHFRDEFKESREEIAHLNRLTELRLRLHGTKGYPSSLNKAYELESKLRREERTGFARTNLGKIHRARQPREAFLFVAEHYDPALLLFEPKLNGLPKELHKEAVEQERFKNLFCRTITALEALTPKGISAAELRKWTMLNSVPLDIIKPFSKAELDSVGFYPTLRRSAETTHAGKRQPTTR